MDQASPFAFDVFQTDGLPDEVLAGVRRLFMENYRDANVPYLEKNLRNLRFLSTATTPGGEMAGFALGEAREIDLPQVGTSNVSLAGLSCVGTKFRRMGLFRRLETTALGANKLPSRERYLSCGRTAHPASFRGFFANPAAVPRPGRVPTEWQQEVGIAIARAYGSHGFEPETFVVKGSGTPIGWPVIEIEATAEEWDMFRHVDRSRGDSLLGIAWQPTPPEGWLS